jgi:UDP-N-acetylmuramyl tripeptide synthase
MGEMFHSEEAFKGRLADIREEVAHDVKVGNLDAAVSKLESIGTPPRQIANMIRGIEAPETRMNKSMIKGFLQHSTEAEKEKLEQMRNR